MNFFANKSVLMVVAHPDDEVIFGWPILQNASKVHVLCCSSDRNNPDRAEFFRRRDALKVVMDTLGFSFTCFDYNSEFYRMPTRDESLSKALATLASEIEYKYYDFVFSHNPMGEYGHIDHILVHQMVAMCSPHLLMTDIFMESNWVPYRKIGEVYQRSYFAKSRFVDSYTNDLAHYNKCKQIYVDHQAWTWSKPPVTNANLYLVQ